MRRLLLAALLLLPIPLRAESPLTIFAAASLTESLQDIAAIWAAQGHPAPKLVFAASSTLARQIEAGAPAQIFASADLQWADYLAAKNLLAPDSRRNLLGNTLVLIVAKSNPARTIDIPALLGPDGRLATGDPAHVPAGIYAEAALRKLGLWDRLQPRLARTQDVRSALMLVARGEAPAGIVYATDAAAEPGVTVAGTLPKDSYPPIVYPFALTKTGDSPTARAFLDFLSSPAAQAVFTKRGFVTEK